MDLNSSPALAFEGQRVGFSRRPPKVRVDEHAPSLRSGGNGPPAPCSSAHPGQPPGTEIFPPRQTKSPIPAAPH